MVHEITTWDTGVVYLSRCNTACSPSSYKGAGRIGGGAVNSTARRCVLCLLFGIITVLLELVITA